MLSEREKEVLRLFCLVNPKIAKRLFIQTSSVRTHTVNIFSKLNCNSKAAAVVKAIKLGLIDIEDVEINERS